MDKIGQYGQNWTIWTKSDKIGHNQIKLKNRRKRQIGRIEKYNFVLESFFRKIVQCSPQTLFAIDLETQTHDDDGLKRVQIFAPLKKAKYYESETSSQGLIF